MGYQPLPTLCRFCHWSHFVFSVFVHIDCNKRGQTSRPVVGPQIQTSCDFEKSVFKCNCYVGFVRSYWRSILLFGSDPYTRQVEVYSNMYMCMHLRSKIFFALRRSQIHVQGQVKRAIPLYLARYKKAVHSALWVQLTLVVCYLPFGIVTTFLPKAGEIFFLVYLIALTLIQLNSSLNPFIYCWKISEVRKAVKDTIRELFCSLSQLISISICLISICFSNSSFGLRSLDIAWIPELTKL